MVFEVVANNLRRNSEIKSLKLQNKEYAVTIFYYGDYAKDAEEGHCLEENISLHCKPRGGGFPLSYVGGRVVMDIPPLPMVSISDIDALKARLDAAGEAAMELEDIIKKSLKKYLDIQSFCDIV